MALLWKTATEAPEAEHSCPGGLEQYESHRCSTNHVIIKDGERQVTVVGHGDYGASGYMSHLPGGDENSDDRTGVGEAIFKGDGTLDNIGVAWNHQRKGYGRMTWDAAHHLADIGGMPHPRHSVERTDDGDAFAHGVGGQFPDEPRKRVFR